MNSKLPQKLGKLEALLEEVENLKLTIEKKQQSSRSQFGSLSSFAQARGVIPLDSIRLQSARHLKAHVARVHFLKWSSDDQYLVSVGQEGCIIIWVPELGYIHNIVEAVSVQPLTCDTNPDASTIYCGGLSANAAVYTRRPPAENDTYSEYEFIMQMDHQSRLSCINYLGDNSLLTAADSEGCTLWEIEKGKKVRTFKGHLSSILCTALMPNNNLFLTGSSDATIRLWDLRKPKASCIQMFEGHESDVTSLALVPENDGQYFVSGSDDTWCCLYDIRADNLVARYSDPVWREMEVGREGLDDSEAMRPEPPSVASVSLSKSGRLIFAGCKDGIIYCFDIFYPEKCVCYREESGPISYMSMSHQGNGIACAVWDDKNRIRLWVP